MAKYIIEELRDHLIAEGIARHPRSTDDPSLPPVYVQPDEGAPYGLDKAAGDPERSDTTITLTYADFEPDPTLQQFFERRHIDILVRSEPVRGARSAEDIFRAIRNSLDWKQAYELSTLHVEVSQRVTGPQEIVDIDANENGVFWAAVYRFLVRNVHLEY